MERVRCRSRWICREGGRWEVCLMMMMGMKERPIGKSSQTSVGAAFIGWCFKSRNGL